jgi:hypothetical protein
VELNHYNTDPSKSKNGEVVIVGNATKSCKIVLTDYEARGLFGRVFDFINGVQLKELMQGIPLQQTPDVSIQVVVEEPKQAQEEPKEEVVSETPANVPVVPGKGKLGGKLASEIPSGQQAWFIDKFKENPEWNEVVSYLKGVGKK